MARGMTYQRRGVMECSNYAGQRAAGYGVRGESLPRKGRLYPGPRFGVSWPLTPAGLYTPVWAISRPEFTASVKVW